MKDPEFRVAYEAEKERLRGLPLMWFRCPNGACGHEIVSVCHIGPLDPEDDACDECGAKLVPE